jgi:hypothetical protein
MAPLFQAATFSQEPAALRFLAAQELYWIQPIACHDSQQAISFWDLVFGSLAINEINYAGLKDHRLSRLWL